MPRHFRQSYPIQADDYCRSASDKLDFKDETLSSNVPINLD
ncbi:hypothetical protein EMIT0P260_80085 [Pseudomonas sp. IT-P260]